MISSCAIHVGMVVRQTRHLRLRSGFVCPSQVREHYISILRRCTRVTVRDGVLGDLEGIYQVEQSVQERETSWSDAQIAAELNRGIASVLVAYDGDGGRICGWLVGWCLPPFEFQILQLTVHTAYHRQGIGTQLLKHAFKAHDVRAFVLEVREGNIAAISLYQKLGFVVTGIRRKYYKDGENAALMQRPGLIQQ